MPDTTATVVAIFGTSFVVGLSGAMSPGPLLALDIREAARIGFRAGPYISFGHALLELGVVILLALGLSRLLQQDLVVASIGLLGGAFLLWMGWRILRYPVQDMLSATAARASFSPGRPVLGGILVSLSNPFWTLWWATIGVSYMVWALQLGAIGLASFYTGHILSDIAWYSLVAFLVASGRRFMGTGVYRGVMVLCGLSLWVIAGYFIYAGIDILVG